MGFLQHSHNQEGRRRNVMTSFKFSTYKKNMSYTGIGFGNYNKILLVIFMEVSRRF